MGALAVAAASMSNAFGQTSTTVPTIPTKVSLVLIDPAKPVTVTVSAPKGWTKSAGDDFASFSLASSVSSPSPYLSVSVNCDGDCTVAKIDKTIARRTTALIERAKKPNLNTGDSKLDAVRAPVKVLGQGALKPAGQWVALDVGTPNPKEPYFDGFKATCLLHRPNDDYFIQTDIGVSRKDKALFPMLLAACKATK